MKKIIYVFAILSIIGAGCSKSFFDVNTDPNNAATSTPKLTLPAGIASSAYVLGGWYQLLGGFWAQHWTQSTGASQWTKLDDYSLLPTDFDTRQYAELYVGSLNDLEYVRNVAGKTNDWTYYLVATCIQAYTFQVLADLYDKVPFSEALKGDGNLAPKWDNGSLVYDSLIARLNYAISKDLTTKSVSNPLATSSVLGDEDLVFQGDMKKWIQFANTLKLKIYLRQVIARPNIASSGIIALLATNNFLSVDAKVTAFGKEQNKRNPIYETGVDRLSGNIVASYTLLNFLVSNGDPRLDYIYTPPAGKPQTGLKQGHYKSDAPTYPTITSLSTPNLQALDPVYYFMASESYFLQAEAQLRYGTDAAAQALYIKGIQASMTKLGATNNPTLYNTGGVYAYPTTPPATANEKLKAIITQKWIALANSESLEAFFDQNRTGYPDFLTISPTNVTSNMFPKRLLFPNSERRSNPNTPAQVPITTPVWWAIQ
ncbi:MAG: SusD/RagB family nutrient-binding outer membrane lipoprotein [Bacteroidota bacterium]|nr:SusD/RagB family nutrient-binding outer membrane lipoprotein [Bacteroidota bacterium]